MNWMVKFIILLLVAYGFAMLRLEVAYLNQMKILKAIEAWIEDERKAGRRIDTKILKNKESYDATVMRLWDFGCKRILPLEDYEKIKGYLKKADKKQ